MPADQMSRMKDLFQTTPELKGERILLRRLTEADAEDLQRLTRQADVYRYLPTFLFEQQYTDAHEVILRLYDECLNDSMILGIFLDNRFCGLAEIYGYRRSIRKVSVGYRLLKEYWGMGIATEALHLMTDHLLKEKQIEIITASTMIENRASARVLEKNGFALVAHAAEEDWGFETPTPTDKWIL